MYFKHILFVFFFSNFDKVLSSCGTGVQLFRTKSGEISSPNYPSPYDHNLMCKYRIIVEENRKIVVEFKAFKTEKIHDTLFIYDGGSLTHQLLGNFSGTIIPPSIMSSQNQLFIVFKTDHNANGSGFKLVYHSILTKDCNWTMSEMFGFFNSPDYPDKYPYHISCTWTIKGPEKSFIILSFIDFETEAGHDFLEIYDGFLGNNSLVANYSGVDKPKSLLSSSNIFILKFATDENIERRGFNISYKIKQSGFDVGMAYITTSHTLVTLNKNSLVEYFPGNIQEAIKILPLLNEGSLITYYTLLPFEFQIYSPNNSFFKSIDGIQDFAFDFTHGLLFVMNNNNNNNIKVIDIKDNNIYQIFNIKFHSRYLRVNERHSILIWSVTGEEPKIFSSNYDGTNQSIIYSNNKQVFHLAVDYETERYYFVDIKDYSLYSIDFNGNNEEYYMTSENMFESLNSISLWNNDLYLCNKQIIYRITELQSNISKAEILFKSYEFEKMQKTFLPIKDKEFFEIDSKVIKRKEFNYLYLPETQNNFTNKCEFTNCSHLCLPILKRFRCMCPPHFILINGSECHPKYLNQNNIHMENNLNENSGKYEQTDINKMQYSTINDESQYKHKEDNESMAEFRKDSEMKYSCDSYTFHTIYSILIAILTTALVVITYLGHQKLAKIEKSYFIHEGNLPLLELESNYAQIKTLKNRNLKDKQDFTQI